MRRLRAWVAAAALGLAACATLPPEEIAGSRTPFDLSGRVLVHYGDRAFSSGVRWQHGPERDELWLLTPLGQTLAHIVSNPDGATLTGADRREYRATSVESLTHQALDWELPLTRLQYWVRGEVAPGGAPAAAERNADGRLLRLEQDGWRIAFAYYPPGQHAGLPRRLELTGASSAIRLVIDDWRGETPAS